MPAALPRFVRACLLALSLGTACLAAADRPDSTVLVVGLPHGGCSLKVSPDGSARIAYGAMPRSILVRDGHFAFDKLRAVLREKAVPRDRVKGPRDAIGVVLFPDANGIVQYVENVDFVRGLLRSAWDNRIPPEQVPPDRGGYFGVESLREDYRWVAKACAFD